MSKHNIVSIFFLTILVLLALTSLFAAISVWVFVALCLVWFHIAFIGSSAISLNYHVKAYCGNDAETKKIISITFDDGPNAFTEPVLDVLKDFQAPAAFFCIGRHIEQKPALFKRMVDEGHIVGNHSYSHSPMFDFFRQARVKEEIELTDRMIKTITGKRVRLFRPPYGVTTPSIRRALAETMHHVVGWNIRSYDTVIKNEEKLLNRIKARIRPGGIILLHDSSERTVRVLKQLLLFLQEQDYTVVSLEQLLNIRAYED